MTAAVAALVAGLVTLLASPVIIRILVRAQRFDHPNARSSHSTPTPRGGGLAVLLGLGSVAVLALALHAWSASVWAVVGGTAALSAVGLIEDMKGLSPLHRLGA